MAEQGKSAFGFDQTVVDRWDARETGQALAQLLTKVSRISRTAGNDEQIRAQLKDNPDAIAGLEHVKEMLREPSEARLDSDR